MRHRRLSPSLMLAALALAVSLGGVGYAASVRLPVNSVGSKQVINHSLRKVDFNRASARGLRGPRGPVGPFPGALPSGKTARGAASIGARATASGQSFEEGISFVFTLAAPPAATRIAVGAPTTAACPGANPPQAAPGNFCFYETARDNLDFGGFVDPASNAMGTAGTAGVTARYESNGSGDVLVRGSWAVTAR